MPFHRLPREVFGGGRRARPAAVIGSESVSGAGTASTSPLPGSATVLLIGIGCSGMVQLCRRNCGNCRLTGRHAR